MKSSHINTASEHASVAIAKKLKQDFGLTPVIATEIEFYLHGVVEHYVTPQVIDLIRLACGKAGIALASAEEERGPSQFEVALAPSRGTEAIVSQMRRFRQLMTDVFNGKDIHPDFSAKPLPDAPGSGLHVHVHLENDSGENAFFRSEEDDAFSPALLSAVGGMLFFLNPCMTVFAPKEESYKRFARNSNAPTTISWGTNNRSVAVRLPTKPMAHKHIEHRVSGSDADEEKVIGAILAGIHYGLAHNCDPGKPVYGDAGHPQYAMPQLARNLEEAKRFRDECLVLETYNIG